MRDSLFFCKGENSTSFIRFYPDGTVIQIPISITDIDIEKILFWTNKENYNNIFSKGTYYFEDNKLKFELVSNTGKVIYEGYFKDNTISFSIHSLVNGNKSVKIFTNLKTDNNSFLETEIVDTIHLYSGICSLIAIQPIPFADIFILTPTQILMGSEIAKIRGYEISDNSVEIIFKEITGIIGLGIIAQQLSIGAYKTFLPFLGGITTIPLVYGLTFGIGKVVDYYIITKLNGSEIDHKEIQNIFKFSRKLGEKEGKEREKQILNESKKTNFNKY
jgi:uncharacterized protein (DUF697 family)